MNFHIAQMAAAASITRPNDTTAYADLDLVANSTTAGSVTPFSFTVPSHMTMLPFRLQTGFMTAAITSAPLANASFRVHFYTTSPTVANGDNAALSTTAAYSSWIGFLDTTHRALGSAGTRGLLVPASTHGFPIVPAGTATLYALIEAKAAYTPVAQTVFSLTVDGYYGW